MDKLKQAHTGIPKPGIPLKKLIMPVLVAAVGFPAVVQADSWDLFDLRCLYVPQKTTEVMSGSLVVDTGGTPTMTLDGATFATGDTVEDVAVFKFSTLRLGSGCTVTL